MFYHDNNDVVNDATADIMARLVLRKRWAKNEVIFTVLSINSMTLIKN
jgi:hypothetical protein